MRILFLILTLSFTSTAFGESLNCARDIHPIEKAECFLKQLIADGTNVEITQQVQKFLNSGLTPSTETSVAFVGGSCESKCEWNYIVSTDYYDVKNFKSIVILVSAKQGPGAPILKKVFASGELE